MRTPTAFQRKPLRRSRRLWIERLEDRHTPAGLLGNVLPPLVTVTESPVAAITSAVAPVVSTTVAPVSAVVSTVVAPVVTDVVAPVVGTVAPVVDAVVTPVVTGIVTPVVDAVTPIIDAIVPVVTGTVAPIIDAVVPVVTPVVDAVDLVVTPIVEAVQPVVSIVTPVVDAAVPVVTPVVNTVVPVVDAVAPIIEAVTPVVDAVAPVVNTVVPPVIGILTPVVGTISPVVTPVVDPVAEAVDPVLDVVVPVLRETTGALPVLPPVVLPTSPLQPELPVGNVGTPPVVTPANSNPTTPSPGFGVLSQGQFGPPSPRQESGRTTTVDLPGLPPTTTGLQSTIALTAVPQLTSAAFTLQFSQTDPFEFRTSLLIDAPDSIALPDTLVANTTKFTTENITVDDTVPEELTTPVVPVVDVASHEVVAPVAARVMQGSGAISPWAADLIGRTGAVDEPLAVDAAGMLREAPPGGLVATVLRFGALPWVVMACGVALGWQRARARSRTLSAGYPYSRPATTV